MSPGIRKRPPARILDISTEDYHEDPCAVPSLSASVAKLLIENSPAHAWLYHPKLGGASKRSTKPMRRGSLVDSLLLGGRDVEVIGGFADWRKKEAQERREAAEQSGRIPCLSHEYEAALVIVERIRAQLPDFGLTLDGSSQLIIEWAETASNGAPVVCRGMLDNVNKSQALIWDLKVRDDVKPSSCERQIVDMGYDIQGAAYLSATAALWPELVGRLRFVNLFAEANPPHCLTPLEFAGSMQELGAMKWRRAVDTWEQCLRLNKWPGYLNEIQKAEAPAWAMAQEMVKSYGENL